MFGNPYSGGRRIVLALAVLVAIAAIVWLLQAQQQTTSSPGSAFTPRISRPGGSVQAPLSAGQVSPLEKQYPNGVRVVHEVKHDLSPALRDIPAKPPRARQREAPENPNPLPLNNEPVEDPVVQRYFGPLTMVTPTLTFEGISSSTSGCGCLPPDTNGDVGPNHYVQTVNTAFQIWNKSGSALTSAQSISTLFTGFGGVCEFTDDGDPIALYDSIADRWFINQFTSNPPYSQCTAVSKTGDPTGAYWRYQFTTSNTDFYDYQKYGVWPDGYYMTANVFGPSGGFSRPSMIAFDRAKMLAGQTATFQEFNPGNFYADILPSDFDGTTLPPAGSPNYFATIAGSNDRFRLWKFHVDWANPGSSTLTGPTNLLTAPYDPNLCGNAPCVPQQGTVRLLDTLGDHTMYRLAYRNMGTYETLVTNHSVDVGGDTAAIRWYEVRDPNANPFIYQQGTYAPDSLHRWMGSAAMDKDGNIAIGYSASSSSTFPSIRYAGRLATDTLGVLGQGEAIMTAGGGSQTSTSGRWGDYSGMVIDPTDDCTFWFTTEYYSATSSSSWKTRIGKFKFPSCGAPVVTPTGTPPTSTPTLVPTNTPLPTAAACSNYTYTTSLTGSIVPGTTDTGNHCDDCSVPITLPFPVNLYENSFTNATLSSNGNIQFVTTDFAFGNACLPVPIFEYGIVAYWDDLITDCTDCGIFTSVSGSAPNRILNIEWITEVLGAENTPANFEIRLYEGQTKFDLVYGTVAQNGNGATIGVQRDIGASTQYSCETVNVLTNRLISFTLPPCGSGGTATPTTTRTATVTGTPPTATRTPTATTTSVPSSTRTPTAIATSTVAVEPTACTINFPDNQPGDTFYEYIQCLACRGVISGYPDGMFHAERKITRGQISKVVSNAAGFNEDPGDQIYEDVPPGSTYYDYINRLSNRGIMSGYPCPERPNGCSPDNPVIFLPNANATRGQLAKIVSNAAGYNEAVSGQYYADVPPTGEGSQFYEWIMRLTNRGVMSGYPCGGPGEGCDAQNRPYFRWNAQVTRGQASKIVANTFFPECETPAN